MNIEQRVERRIALNGLQPYVTWRRAQEKFPKPRPRRECVRNPSIEVGVTMPKEDLERFQAQARVWAREVGRPPQNSFSAFVRFCLDDSISQRAVRRKHERRRLRL